MDDRKLKTFLTAVRTGSFSKTADEMNFSQSAVSQMMNSLESELGCKVLERTHSGIKLTSAGEALLPLIMQAEASLTLLRKQAELISEGEAAPIRIGCFASISKAWLPMILHEYQELHPEANFEIMVGGDDLMQWLQDGVVDVILADIKMDKELTWYPLFEEGYYALIPESYGVENEETITQEEFSKYPLILAPSNPFHQFLDRYKKKALKVSVDDDSTLIALVEQGLGVTIMPEICVRNVPKNVRILKLTPTHMRTLGMAVTESASKSVEKFCKYLYKHHSQNAKKVS